VGHDRRVPGPRIFGENIDGSPVRRHLLAALVLSCALLVASCSSAAESATSETNATSSISSAGTARARASEGAPTAGSGTTVPSAGAPATGPAPAGEPTPEAVAPSPAALPTTGDPSAGQTASTTADQPGQAAPQRPPAAAAPTVAPGQGNVAIEIPEVAVSTQAAVPMTSSASFAGAVTASVASVRSTTAEAIGPGEIGGPAIAVTVEIVNGSGNPVDLDTVYVTLNDSTDSPGIPTSGSPARPFFGPLPAGAHAQGVYVFTVAESLRDPVTVLVGYATAAEVVSFVGNVA
jgi:hypothetical protein